MFSKRFATRHEVVVVRQHFQTSLKTYRVTRIWHTKNYLCQLGFCFNFQLAQYILEDEVATPSHGTPAHDLLGFEKWAQNQTRFTVYYDLAFIFKARLREYLHDVKAAMFIVPKQ